MSDKKTEKQVMQEAIGSAISFLTTEQKRKVMSFIILLPHQWTAVINESVKSLTVQQMKQVLEFIATMPADGK